MSSHDPAPKGPEAELFRPAIGPSLGIERITGPLLGLGIFSTGVALAIFFLLGGRWRPRLLAVAPLDAAGLVSGALLLAALGFFACFCMARARRRSLVVLDQPRRAVRRSDWYQTAITVLFAGAAACVVLVDRPLPAAGTDGLTASLGFEVASALLILAAPWLIAERYAASIPAEPLPERDDLRRLVFLPVVFLAAEAVLQIALALGFGDLHLARVLLAMLLLLICAELIARAIAMWFLPPRDASAARALIGSFFAGVLRGQSLTPGRVAAVVQSQLGMDFSRSQALRFMAGAATPVLLVMLGFCWFLTGVTRVGLDQRGSYERFGSSVAVLHPGLHLLLPWPFGGVRHVELGVVHGVSISYGDAGMAREIADYSTAEGDAPANANRLWDAAQPSDVSYVIASGGPDQQSFQTVSASVSVLYRTGVSDADARAALYRQTDASALVKSLTGRLLAHFFATHTLPNVLGENHTVIANDLKVPLQTSLDQLGSGIQIVAVIIEAIHPPSGAASAYRNVQAAEIEATTSIERERGHAETTRSVAEMNAHNAIDDASAWSAENISGAAVDLTNITADDRPFHAASQVFLLERYFSDLKTALAHVPLEIVDHRLSIANLPTIDLRPAGADLTTLPTRLEKAR